MYTKRTGRCDGIASETPTGRYAMRDIRIDGGLILKFILKK
jgi:hypothetical protein